MKVVVALTVIHSELQLELHLVNMCRGGGSVAGTTAASFVTRYDKLDQKEIKDLLLCFLYVIRNLSEGKSILF